MHILTVRRQYFHPKKLLEHTLLIEFWSNFFVTSKYEYKRGKQRFLGAMIFCALCAHRWAEDIFSGGLSLFGEGALVFCRPSNGRYSPLKRGGGGTFGSLSMPTYYSTFSLLWSWLGIHFGRFANKKSTQSSCKAWIVTCKTWRKKSNGYDRFCHEMEVLEHKEDVQNMLLLLFWQIIAKTSLVPEATKIKIISAPLTGKFSKRKQLTNILTPYCHKTIVCNDALVFLKPQF